ncbi:uncharacterized protein LOC126823831 [Patella vulgata]|uniref:uncharacterized protein LOC126823831 n=1 Tax=Patella vulgata TaxID=6465 RepID=UPI00217FFC15|nr:uncharacterized protein LOC126823831 [Patella vulgata]
MCDGSGELQYSPPIAPTSQTIHGTVQKIIQEGNKKTYVIVIKPNNESNNKPQKKPASRPQFTKLNPASSDIVKQNLSNITDDDYDSKNSAANLFLNDDDDGTAWQDDGEFANFCRKKPNDDLDSNRRIDSTASIADVHISNDSGFIATPPNLQFMSNKSTARQIMMDSPEFQTTPEQQRICSVIGKLDDGFKPSPLASSTPINSALPSERFASPDSGIYSASSSMLSPTISTPDGIRPTEILITKLIERPALNNHSDDIGSSQEEGGEDKLNTSLANIQWLGGFVLEKEEKKEHRPHVVNRMSVEDKCRRKPFELDEIDRLCRDCGHEQRPPYSYMVLIQLALSSASDHKMTLKEICKWIEDKFEYFKSIAKPGWKNSIRHNLSFYHCFVRDLSNQKKHGSKWMLQFDPVESHHRDPLSERVVTSQASNTRTLPTSMPQTVIPFVPVFSSIPQNNLMPIPQNNIMFPSLSQYPVHHQQQKTAPQKNHTVLQNMGTGGLHNKKRKNSGPLPILPRPASLQTYALVPLQNVQQQHGNNLPTIPSSNRPILVNIPNNPFTQNIPLHSNVQPVQNQHTANILQQSKKSNTISSNEPVSLVRQAWIDAQCCMSEDDREEPNMAVPFQERPAFSNTENKNNEVIVQHAKKQKVKAGLPVPTIYTNNNLRKTKRTKSRIKSNSNHTSSERNLLDSSDSECDSEDDKISDLPTPIRQLFSDTPSMKNNISTSTPVRHAVTSIEQLPSPIRGFTPVRCGNIFDGSFLDMIQEEVFASLAGSPNAVANNLVNQDSPNVSLSDFGLFRTPPDKKSGRSPQESNHSHGQSLCRFLADFPIDSNIIAEAGGISEDLSLNLNWSNNHGEGTEDLNSK